jgi:multidrug efflux system outer membrane protein
MNRSLLSVGLTAAVLTGCSIGPKYERPAPLAGTTALPGAFSEGSTNAISPGTNNAQWKAAEPSAHLPRGAWWTIFNDPELNRLEDLASSSNQELAGGLARLEQARALVNVARSDLYPNINFSPSYNRERTSANQASRSVANNNFNAFSVPLDASWELDLWGRVRKTVDATRARFAAATDDLEALRLSIQAEVAVNYFTYRSVEADSALLQQAIQAFTRSLELTRNRRAGGIASDLDVSQAETQLRATEALIPDRALQQSKLRHALATLTGQAAPTFQITARKEATPNPAIPVALPSELLERRPDIAAAERRMAAANADVGIAQTAYYPRILFRGLAGFQSVDIGTLFDWPSRFWAVGPSIELPIFNAGRNRARLQVQQAAYNETVANYRDTVLRSFQEVEDQLAAQRYLGNQLEAETAALVSAQRTLAIAENRYKAGLVTYLEVATSQTAALEREREVVRLRAEKLTASAGLAKALGGGWQPQETSRK